MNDAQKQEHDKHHALKDAVIQAAIEWYMTDAADIRFAANSGFLAAAVAEYCEPLGRIIQRRRGCGEGNNSKRGG